MPRTCEMHAIEGAPDKTQNTRLVDDFFSAMKRAWGCIPEHSEGAS